MAETAYEQTGVKTRARVVKNRKKPIEVLRTKNVSPEQFLFENRCFSQLMSRKKTPKKPYFVTLEQKRAIMRTGVPKEQKTTDISFDKSIKIVYIRTHNTDLKNRLTAFSEKHPDLCRMTEDDADIGCMSFEIDKRRLSIRLTVPYTEERRKNASEYAKKNGFQSKPES